MKKFISLLKAMMSQDMNMFKFKTKTNSSKLKKIMFPLMIACIFMMAIGLYYSIFAVELSKLKLTYIMLSIAMLLPTFFTLIEAIYKSQGILYDTKDNDLLFSLPIEKKAILTARLCKMYIFQLMYNLLFLIPAYVFYIYYDHPGIKFYIITLFMTLLLPIIPTVIGCLLGIIVKNISVKFKSKKAIQLILTFTIFLGIYLLSFKSNDWISYLINNAKSVNEIITKIYFPIGAYIELINKFDFILLLKLIAINIIPLIIFIYIAGITYFKTISKSKENGVNRLSNKKITYKQKSILRTLIFKELKKYFSSTVYVFNTLFGLILLLIATIGLSLNFEGTISVITENGMSQEIISNLYIFAPKVYYALIILMISMTSITSASISIEGKTFNILKSLPVSEKKIFLSKIFASIIIIIPFVVISNIIFFIFFSLQIFDVIAISLITILMPLFSSLLGLNVNLKYPKMNASSDTEVVKQSMSTAISLLIGMITAGTLIGLLFINSIDGMNIALNTIVMLELILISLIIIVLWIILIKKGKKKYRQIEI